MIAQLRGNISNTTHQEVVLDIAGVGYGVYVPEDDRMQLEEGSEVLLHIYEHIQERAHDLYGFTQYTAKKLFEHLLSVNGVGPKAALAILDLGPVSNVKQAIVDGNAAYISGASGVGKKTAERVTVDLKDKLLDDVLSQRASADSPSVASTDNDALEALVSLGYSRQQAIAALQSVEGDSTEELVKHALKEMS